MISSRILKAIDSIRAKGGEPGLILVTPEHFDGLKKELEFVADADMRDSYMGIPVEVNPWIQESQVISRDKLQRITALKMPRPVLDDEVYEDE